MPINNSHQLQIENSLVGKCLRRWRFCVRYGRARARWNTLRRLELVLANDFGSPDGNRRSDWISHVAVRLRAVPGLEDRELRIAWPGGRFLLRLRLFPWRQQGCQANWSAPVAVMVFKRGKDGGIPIAVRCVSCFIEGDTLHVAQLQGIRKIEMPAGLRDWAERMVRACMEFAREENLRGVSVALAHSQYSFHHPYIGAGLSAEERTREIGRIRARMQAHLDGTARALGWPLEGEWFKWSNPNYRKDARWSRERQDPGAPGNQSPDPKTVSPRPQSEDPSALQYPGEFETDETPYGDAAPLAARQNLRGPDGTSPR